MPVDMSKLGGTKWENMPHFTTGIIQDIWGITSNDIFAVDEYGKIFHFDGTTWSRFNQSAQYPLYGIWGSSPSNLFAVGHFGVIMHYPEGPATHIDVSIHTSYIFIFFIFGILFITLSRSWQIKWVKLQKSI